jgi:hypothetical protein
VGEQVTFWYNVDAYFVLDQHADLWYNVDAYFVIDQHADLWYNVDAYFVIDQHADLWYNVDAYFVLDQHADLNFYSASSLKQQFEGRHVTSQTVFVLVTLTCLSYVW